MDWTEELEYRIDCVKNPRPGDEGYADPHSLENFISAGIPIKDLELLHPYRQHLVLKERGSFKRRCRLAIEGLELTLTPYSSEGNKKLLERLKLLNW
ncbi:MAG: hypothetical protein ACXABY_27730 [Candidatus Thorarchaeota archaeon]|jgi:hypothetical protein